MIIADYTNKTKPFADNVAKIEKTVILKTIDKAWSEQIDQMTKLRDGIHLRAYAQNDPLQAYKEEGYIMFDNMMNSIAKEVVNFLNNLVFNESETN